MCTICTKICVAGPWVAAVCHLVAHLRVGLHKPFLQSIVALDLQTFPMAIRLP